MVGLYKITRGCRFTMLIMIFSLTLMACGGGGGGDDDNNQSSQTDDSQWGSMVWDEGQWG